MFSQPPSIRFTIAGSAVLRLSNTCAGDCDIVPILIDLVLE